MGTMTLFARGWIALAGVLGTLLIASAAAAAAGGANADPLDMYRATVDRAQAAELGRDGYDIASARQTAAGTQVDLVLTTRERDRLRSLVILAGAGGRRESASVACPCAGPL
jgi:hypothetical protein